jgi:low affinity Fe/Cu permease
MFLIDCPCRNIVMLLRIDERTRRRAAATSLASRHAPSMARRKTKMKAAAAPAPDSVKKTTAKNDARSDKTNNKTNTWSDLFGHMAMTTAHWTGKPIAFLIASAAVIVWAATGPLFHYSDTWQLVINTSTTIVTFLMVFLIQNTQNRDTMALQLKLSELVLAMKNAENRFASAEDLSDDELEKLHQELRTNADAACETLNRRRASKNKKAS